MRLEDEDLKYIWHPCSQMKDYETFPPIVIDHAKGVYLYDIYGKEYIDIISSWWCNLLGHCNDRINQSIKEQLDILEHVIFANFSHQQAIKLSKRLVELTNNKLHKCFYSDNGSASVEIALKMSFQYQAQRGYKNKTRFMCLTNAYHGETIGALSVSGIDLYSKIYKPLLLNKIEIQAPDCYRCPFNKDRYHCNIECSIYVDKAFEQFGSEVSALIIEPILQAGAGMRIYPTKYIEYLRVICDEYNVLLIVDEIATGFGRTGRMFAFNHTNIYPDIMCVSKGLTAGYIPMAITLVTDKIYNNFYDDYNKGTGFMHSHTYSGNPLGCRIANTVLDILIEDNIISSIDNKGEFLYSLLLSKFQHHKYIGEIRRIGMICALELVENKHTKKGFDTSKRIGYAIYLEALKYGLLLRPLGNVLYFNPPLIISNDELIKAVDITSKAIDKVLY